MSKRLRRTLETVRFVLLRTITGVVLVGLADFVGLAACAGIEPGTGVQIDWENVVQFGGIQYLASTSHIGRAPTDADVGPVFATVQFKLDGNVHDLGYQLKDGDAAYLDAGTSVSSVRGYAPTFRLVARFAGRLTFYEADTNPRANSGADLLDFGGKVRSISVISQQDDTTELGAVTDPTQVVALVAMVMIAHVDRHYQEHSSPTYFIAFHLDDGTAVTRAYWLGSGQLARGILLSPSFGDTVKQAVAARAVG